MDAPEVLLRVILSVLGLPQLAQLSLNQFCKDSKVIVAMQKGSRIMLARRMCIFQEHGGGFQKIVLKNRFSGGCMSFQAVYQLIQDENPLGEVDLVELTCG